MIAILHDSLQNPSRTDHRGAKAREKPHCNAAVVTLRCSKSWRRQAGAPGGGVCEEEKRGQCPYRNRKIMIRVTWEWQTGNIPPKLTKARFSFLLSFPCQPGFGWLFTVQKLCFEATCLFGFPAFTIPKLVGSSNKQALSKE
jgi:hypothetical protein